MTYPAKLSPEATEALAPLEEKITSLEENKFLILEDTPEAMKRFRYHLYTWLFVSGIKDYYRVKQLSPEKIMIIRLGRPRTPQIKESALSSVEAFVKEELLEVLEEDEARERLKKAILDGELVFEDYDRGVEEWRRVNG